MIGVIVPLSDSATFARQSGSTSPSGSRTTDHAQQVPPYSRLVFAHVPREPDRGLPDRALTITPIMNGSRILMGGVHQNFGGTGGVEMPLA